MIAGPMLHLDSGKREIIAKEPLIPDPYEQNMVHVKVSKMKGGGEGLFARRDLPKGRIVSYYNGVKATEKEIVSTIYHGPRWLELRIRISKPKRR